MPEVGATLYAGAALETLVVLQAAWVAFIQRASGSCGGGQQESDRKRDDWTIC